MADPLRKIELQLENIFEKKTGALSAQSLSAGKILARLIEALEESARPGPDGRWIAPNVFHLAFGKRISQSAVLHPGPEDSADGQAGGTHPAKRDDFAASDPDRMGS